MGRRHLLMVDCAIENPCIPPLINNQKSSISN